MSPIRLFRLSHMPTQSLHDLILLNSSVANVQKPTPCIYRNWCSKSCSTRGRLTRRIYGMKMAVNLLYSPWAIRKYTSESIITLRPLTNLLEPVMGTMGTTCLDGKATPSSVLWMLSALATNARSWRIKPLKSQWNARFHKLWWRILAMGKTVRILDLQMKEILIIFRAPYASRRCDAKLSWASEHCEKRRSYDRFWSW